MSAAARRPGGSWVSQSYDKLALVVVLTALLASAILLVLRIGGYRRGFDVRASAQAGDAGKRASPIDIALFTDVVHAVSRPYQVPPQGRRMFVGEVRVASIPDGAPIPFGAATDPFTGQPQPAIDFDPDSDGDGISDKLELTHGLNPNDPADATQDQDGDGYSNIEEVQSGTDLRDAEKFPPPAAKLRLVRTVVNPFKLRFLGISRLPDGDRYQLNLRTLERTYFPRMGDEVEGHTLLAYEEKAPDGPTLVLKQGETVIRLIQGRVINQEARSALMIFLIDGSRLRLQLGDEFKLKDRAYKVIDIKVDRVLIRDEQEGKDTTVGLLSDEDRARLQGGGGLAPTAPPASASPIGGQP